MNAIRHIGLLLGGMSLMLVGACHDSQADVAHVNNSKPSHQVCTDEVVTSQKPAKDKNQVLGTVAGALVGGVVGHQIGHGTGQDVATVGGAVAGGYAGNRVEKSVQKDQTQQTTQRVCRRVYD
jgi:uncharacterized protein YcfJ